MRKSKIDAWTFIITFEGGEYISQILAADIGEAIDIYNNEDPSGLCLVPLDTYADMEPTAVRGMNCVWRTGGLRERDEKFIECTIVKTSQS